MNTAPLITEQPVDGRSARWASHREQRRIELIKAARRAVHRLGPDASMDDIAAAAGTSKSVFYRYFGDKAGLQQAVGELAIGQMQTAVLSAAKTARSPQQGLQNMVSAYLHMAQTSPNVYVFVTQNPVGPQAADPSGSSVLAHLDPPRLKQLDGALTENALGGFFDAIIQMVSAPMQELLAGDPATAPLARYWPTAAIGLVRAAGELWLNSPPTGPMARPDAEEMSRQITSWLFQGINSQLPPQESSRMKDSDD
ncbi:TetR/AcrR family transcriptional regulator [Psychromicrobium sp. YIM B11713]|uniref:TetR/AcrR family transcriptional regulator n=1 Tax=Psychromicrobium sp. YIM B11713 TaxID=3145233 RepID=UPI00374F394C